jgi:hypothetical protein
VQCLVKIIADEKAPYAAKVSAASALMKYGRESIELDDVVQRVEQLEESAKAAEEQKGNGYDRGYGNAA